MSDVAKPPVKQIDLREPFKLRLWPAVVIVGAMLVAIYLPQALPLDNPIIGFMFQMYAPMVAALLATIWWIFFSRVSWLEGFGILGFAIGCAVATMFAMHPSMGMLLVLSTLPRVLSICLAWLIVSFFLSWPVRRLGLLIAIVSTCGYYCLFRFEGVTGEFKSQMAWRWEETKEQKYVASRKAASKSEAKENEGPALVANDEDWVAFRGRRGDSVYSGPPISENWSPNPPKQLWKRQIGPGWGSFVVVGKHVITQEQRDKQEVVAAFDADTGEPLWEYADNARFEEAIAGAGPRATPVFHDGKIYAVGAKGNLHCIDAATGNKIWQSSIVSKDGVEVPMWGYSSSPIIAGEAVITLPGKPDKAAVTAFDAKTGKPLWSAAEGDHSYTSAQFVTLCGVPQVLALTSAGLVGIAPEDGKVLWMHKWSAGQFARCVQPYVEGDTIVISTFGGVGARKVKLSKEGDTWKDELVWEQKKFKPYYNDLVVQDGHAYGFDNNIFCSLDLSNGKFDWKGPRYGCGQVLLLEKQKKLLVLSEDGTVVLLEANPEKIVELTKFKAIEGKTWNHPVVAHGKLFVRNGEEMACFDVSSGEKAATETKESAPSH